MKRPVIRCINSERGYLYEITSLQFIHLPFCNKYPTNGIKWINEIFFLHFGQWDLGKNKFISVFENSIAINL